MDNLMEESEIQLGKSGEYLLKARIVREKYAPYYVRWVRKFISQVPPRPGVSLEDRITIFLDNVRPNAEDWTIG